MKKVLSILLIAAAAFGFYGGAVSINDVLDSKAYWEEEGKKTTKDLNTLEDGLNELKANTAAYKDGLKTYNEGLITLADGKAQYAAGEKALADAESQYGGPGVPTLANAYNTINSMINAKGNLNSAAAIVAGNSGGQVTAAQAVDIYNNVKDLINGYSLDRAVETVAQQGGSDKETVLAAFNGMTAYIKAGYSKENAAFTVVATMAGSTKEVVEAAYNAMAQAMEMLKDENLAAYAVVSSMSGGASSPEQVKLIYESVKAAVDGGADVQNAAYAVVANMSGGASSPEQVKLIYESVKAAVDGGADVETAKKNVAFVLFAQEVSLDPDVVGNIYSAVVTGLETPGATLETVAAALEGTLEVPKASIIAIYNGVGSAITSVGTAYEGVVNVISAYEGVNSVKSAYEGVNNVTAVYDNVSHLKNGYAPEEAYATVAAIAGTDTESIKSVFTNVGMFFNGVSFDQAVAIAAQATGNTPELVKQGYEGYKTYISGKKQLAESLPQIQAGEAQLADGKKKLDQYRDGEKTLREGLATLMGTKADPGLKSIAARVGEKETFTGVDGFFNFDAGYKGLKAGRAYQDDSGVVITKELTSRAVGLGVGIGAGVVALLAAILGLLKKNKVAAVAGLIAAAAAGFGAYYVNAAGTFYSEGAGSTVGNLPMIAMCVLAGVAAIFAIANFAAPKAEVEAKTEA